MNKLGLVFSGGGGKGAYQIGVWKYLHKIGLDNYVQVVSGTSVGALNTVLFGLGNIELAEDIWCNKIQFNILSPHEIFKYLKMIRNLRFGLPAILQDLSKNGVFSRDGLIDIVKNYVDIGKIHN